jgi:PEP-CTERM/exosortase A-associated glycosyltransferase
MANGLEVAAVSSAQQPDDASDNEVNGIAYYRSEKPVLWKSPIREAQLMRTLRRRVSQVATELLPDIIHAHSPVLVGLPAYQVARRFRVPFVYEVRDLWENASVDRGKFRQDSLQYRGVRALETWLVKRADATVAIGESLRERLEDRTGRSVDVVPNGVNPDRFVPLSPEPEWTTRWNPTGGPLIVYLGSFQPYEGLEVLIRSIPAILATVPAANVLIVGDGSARVELESLALEVGVADRVRFTGRVPHDRVHGIYAVADLLVYPRISTETTRLTTPLKPLEPMAMEKAVLASDLPAIREIVTDGETGLLFSAGDSDDLAAKAVRLLRDSSLRDRLGRAGRAQIMETRRWDTAVRRYQAIYERAIASAHAKT